MLRIKGIYEIAIPVKELAKAESFYRNVLGLEVGLRDESRRWLFLRAGGKAGMLVLQEKPDQWQSQHFAFAVSDAELDEATAELQNRGVVVDGPYLNAWMPARSVYFSDVDGHQLEIREENRPSWPGGVARSAGVVVLDRKIRTIELEPPPRLRLRRSHPSWPGGAMGLPNFKLIHPITETLQLIYDWFMTPES